MKTIFGRILISTGLLFLAACSSTIRSNVATFHEMNVPGGERVMLTPMLAENADSIEFRQYANILAGHLQSYGYKEPGDKNPQLIAGFDVTINDGREKLENRIAPQSSLYWRRGLWYYGHYWAPIYPLYHDPFFDDNRVIARTVYTATLKLELRTPDGELVFEGRAEMETRRKDLPKIVPFLAAALFENFPGESGVTRRVVIDREKPTSE